MKTIAILIADDHPMMREALKMALEGEPDLRVIGEANNGQEAVRLAGELNPDVVLMDLLMPGMTGLEAVAALQQSHQEIKIMVVTSLEDKDK